MSSHIFMFMKSRENQIGEILKLTLKWIRDKKSFVFKIKITILTPIFLLVGSIPCDLIFTLLPEEYLSCWVNPQIFEWISPFHLNKYIKGLTLRDVILPPASKKEFWYFPFTKPWSKEMSNIAPKFSFYHFFTLFISLLIACNECTYSSGLNVTVLEICSCFKTRIWRNSE